MITLLYLNQDMQLCIILKRVVIRYRYLKYYVNLEELECKLKNFSYSVRKKECLDIPDKMYIQRHVELSDEQNKAYERIKNISYCNNTR